MKVQEKLVIFRPPSKDWSKQQAATQTCQQNIDSGFICADFIKERATQEVHPRKHLRNSWSPTVSIQTAQTKQTGAEISTSSQRPLLLYKLGWPIHCKCPASVHECVHLCVLLKIIYVVSAAFSFTRHFKTTNMMRVLDRSIQHLTEKLIVIIA